MHWRVWLEGLQVVEGSCLFFVIEEFDVIYALALHLKD